MINTITYIFVFLSGRNPGLIQVTIKYSLVLVFILVIWVVNAAVITMDSSRANMLSNIAQGSQASSSSSSTDVSNKRVLSRGCDPVMAERASKMLPPMLGNAFFEGVTDDETFFAKLAQNQYDVVFLAPGMCRRDPDVVNNYQAQVDRLQGRHVTLLTTDSEREIVPLLRQALGLN